MVIQIMVLPPKRQGRSLSEWFQTTAGADLLEKENALLKKVLPELFGYHLLWTGEGNYCSGVAASSVAHHVRLQAPDKSAAKDCDVIGSHTSLPVQRDSIDVVILPHMTHTHMRSTDKTAHYNRQNPSIKAAVITSPDPIHHKFRQKIQFMLQKAVFLLTGCYNSGNKDQLNRLPVMAG